LAVFLCEPAAAGSLVSLSTLLLKDDLGVFNGWMFFATHHWCLSTEWITKPVASPHPVVIHNSTPVGRDIAAFTPDF